MLKAPRVRDLLTVVAATAVLLLTAGRAPTLAGTSLTGAEDIREITDRYLFQTSLNEFVSIRADTPHDERLIWASDGCSWSPDEPLGYQFATSCYRHDFGYRNYAEQDRFTEANRLEIDEQFREDMYTSCGGDPVCETLAEVYYFAVRQFAGAATPVPEAMDKARVAVEVDDSGAVTGFRAVDRSGDVVTFPAKK